jgi:hypothetical protein
VELVDKIADKGGLDFRWILKGLIESIFVVASILLALAVDEWTENRDYAELADQSLGIFEQEISQNQARLEDAAPYHQGIRDFLAQARTYEEGTPDVRSVMEGLETPVLLNSAWETALATGALTHMEVEVVSALSLTYSLQESFQERSRLDRPRLVSSATLTTRETTAQLQEAYEYVETLAREESELRTVFGQALQMIRAHRGIGHVDEVPEPVDTGDP